jgi:phosphate transport system substrate-binding protein
MSYAVLRNAAGNFVEPTLESTSAAMATAAIPDDFRFSMVNAPGAQAYPIAGASWVLIYSNQTKAEVGHKLVAFLRWAVTDGQELSAQLSYAPLPEAVRRNILKTLDSITYQ